ncbi:hypothetical protein [Nocardia seriolae]|nr:hypothetical protein [Nocardia seriolae]APB00881.1 hypothetical protein NS506_06850 [Nocardia seriolae]MTJ65428.1 hypothetical protein [Nocardia seriolae]MTJ70851.1 hypothetical protein [Nocardia seriolae]MTJ90310.1 hypothetical protein [Nocardia seriolae]MTK34273.1 hypothetical protein [Nocardia seriolae]
MNDKEKAEPDPRARWRKLPPEPTEFIEETDREPAAIDYGTTYDPDAKLPWWGQGAP